MDYEEYDDTIEFCERHINILCHL